MKARVRDWFSSVNLPTRSGKVNVLTQVRLDQQTHQLIEERPCRVFGIEKGQILQAWTLAEKGD